MSKEAAGCRTVFVWVLIALSGLMILSVYADRLESLLIELPAFSAVGVLAVLALRSRRKLMIALPVAAAFAAGLVLTYTRDLSPKWATLTGGLLGAHMWAFVVFLRAWTDTVRAQKEEH